MNRNEMKSKRVQGFNSHQKKDQTQSQQGEQEKAPRETSGSKSEEKVAYTSTYDDESPGFRRRGTWEVIKT